ncbi:acyl carrier protein [Streptomyces sp. NPDC091265]|uniref:acyl carrier protein n=1 Tax=unclassified Streptomyces TaxID=2593676 RepID=UPI00344F87A3
MTTINDLLDLLRDELGLPIGPGDAALRLEQIPGWDSVHLLWLVTTLEQRTGNRLSLPDFLDAPTLGEIHRLATTGARPAGAVAETER